MKHLALLAAAGSLAIFAAPAQAADFAPASPAPASIFVSLHDNASPFVPVAAYGGDDWDDDDDWRDRRDRRRWRARDRDRDRDGDRYRDRDYRDERQYQGRYWRDDDGRVRCRRDDGSTGLLVGAGVGALIGRTIDTRGDRTLGTILGAIGGGLLGREVERGETRCR